MTKSYVMIDLDDPRTAGIAEVISNKTCKRIIGLLAEESLSESELAARLKAPLNTINYNVKKLVKSGLIESNRSFWSVKGRRVQTYKLAQKKIVISPRSKLKGVVPAVLISGVIAWGLRTFSIVQQTAVDKMTFVERGSESVAQAGSIASSVPSSVGNVSDVANVFNATSSNFTNFIQPGVSNYLYDFLANAPNSWAWFFIGAMIGVLIIILWNWFRK